jgi:hypothetical protein
VRSQTRKGYVTTEISIDGIALDSKGRADDIIICEIGQLLSITGTQYRVLSGNASPYLTRLPDAQEPNPLESSGSHFVQELVWYVIQSCTPTERCATLMQKNPSIDLVKERMIHCY